MGQIIDGYVRVSRVQGREGEGYISPKVQEDAIRRWAEYKQLEIGMIHVDEDWSGGSHDRPGLNLAVQRALNGETVGIVAWKIDRFSRNSEAGIRDLNRLRDAGARLAFVVEDIDTGTVYGRMIYQILLAVSEAFLENIKASWVEAKTRANGRGAHIGPTPYGFLRAENGTLMPDPAKAPIVTEAFKRAASLGLSGAQTYLREADASRRWTTTQVRRILENRIYLGELVHGDNVTTVEDYALTDTPTWTAAQSQPATRANADRYPLSGLLTCTSCKRPMVGGRGGKGQRVYRCSGSLAQADEKCPTGMVVTADIVEDYLEALTRRLFAAGHWRVRRERDIDLIPLQNAVTMAQDALAELATMKAALGNRYEEHRSRREQAVIDAQLEYEAAAKAQATSRVPMVDELSYEDDPETARAILRRCYAGLYVRPGRGRKIGDRVMVELFDEDGTSDPDATQQLLEAWLADAA